MQKLAYNVLIVGGGSIGERHARAWNQTQRARSITVCDPSDERRAQLQERHPWMRLATRFEELAIEDFDIALICTPPRLHLAQAGAALRAGCHVLCEKPLAHDLDGVAELLGLAESSPGRSAVAFTLRSAATYERARQLVQQGAIGRPVLTVGYHGQYFPMYRPDYQRFFFNDPQAGGGAMNDHLPHLVNLSEWFLGPTNWVLAHAEHRALPGVNVDDLAVVIAGHDGGKATSQSHLNLIQYKTDAQFRILGERGTIEVDHHNGCVRLFTTPNQLASEENFPAERDTHYIRQIEVFLHAIENDAPVRCSFREGAQTVATIVAARKSARAGQKVAVSEASDPALHPAHAARVA